MQISQRQWLLNTATSATDEYAGSNWNLFNAFFVCFKWNNSNAFEYSSLMIGQSQPLIILIKWFYKCFCAFGPATKSFSHQIPIASWQTIEWRVCLGSNHLFDAAAVIRVFVCAVFFPSFSNVWVFRDFSCGCQPKLFVIDIHSYSWHESTLLEFKILNEARAG